MCLELLPMTRGLRAIPARCHVAPATASVFRVVEKHALAPLIGAATNARELAEDERVRGRFDDRDDKSGECVAHGDERPDERAVGSEIDTARARTATEHTIDLGESFGAYAFAHRAAFCECAQRAAHATRVHERSGSAR